MNNNTNDGGPAFPHENKEFDAAYGAYFPSNSESGHGMSLRDWFAGMALGHIPTLIDCMDENPSYYNIAEHAYGVADAMIKARERKGQP